jgi:hypothetical protein
MKDELLLRGVVPEYGGYIINLQSSTEGHGTHWVFTYINPDGCIYIDPFGAPAPLEISDWYDQAKLRSGWNATKVQNLSSQLCGWYALGMLYYLHNRGSVRESIFNTCNRFINLFGGDETEDNGGILKDFYRNLTIKPNAFVKKRLLSPSVK